MDEHGLAGDKTGNDRVHSAEEWAMSIAPPEGRPNEPGSNTQQKMISMQDYMGQHNAYLQGARIQNNNADHALQSLGAGL